MSHNAELNESGLNAGDQVKRLSLKAKSNFLMPINWAYDSNIILVSLKLDRGAGKPTSPTGSLTWTERWDQFDGANWMRVIEFSNTTSQDLIATVRFRILD